MKKETMNIHIVFLSICAVVAFLCGFINPWAIVLSFIFGGAAMTCAILRNGCKE